MEIKPFGERVIIKPTEEEKQVGRFIIPDSVEREKKCQGEVIESNIQEITKGMIIVYGEFDGTNFKFNEEDLLILSKDEIIAIIK